MSKARDYASPVVQRQVKLRNRRIMGSLMRDGTVSFKFRRLGTDGLIRYEAIRLSIEAIDTMFALKNHLLRLAAMAGKEVTK